MRRLYKRCTKAIAPTIILTVILFVTAFRPLYYHDIGSLDIPAQSGYSVQTIKENYDYTMDYLFSGSDKEFHLPSLKYSQNGKKHFEDVRRLIRTSMWLCLILAICSVFGAIGCVRRGNYTIFRNVGIGILIIPLVFALPFALDFESSFIIFHKIFFRNDYWIFNPNTDPIIKILPQEFFMHAALLIIVLLALCAIISLVIYAYFKEEFKK